MKARPDSGFNDILSYRERESPGVVPNAQAPWHACATWVNDGTGIARQRMEYRWRGEGGPCRPPGQCASNSPCRPDAGAPRSRTSRLC